MAVRVGINGFGRIGRNFFRAQQARGADIEIVAINDLGDAATMAHLLKYDSVLGPFEGDVSLGDGVIIAGGEQMQMLSERDPAALPWGDLGVEVVLESTGFFTSRDGAQKHLDAGASKVIVSAPATDPDYTIVLPQLKGKLDGVAVRAPVPTGSLTDVVVTLGREVTLEEVDAAYQAAAAGPLAGILQYQPDPIVSTDIQGSAYSCIYDAKLTMVHGRNVKLFGWYDNEWGYSCRLVDLVGRLLA